MSNFTDIEYSQRKKITRREKFLSLMDNIIPWERWIDIISPFYFKSKRGRPPRGIDLMLRMYLLQCWFNLSDEATEDAIYDSYALKKFSKIDFYDEQVPDATTLLKFRHLLEKHEIGKLIFDDIQNMLEEQGLIMHGGSIVDATIIDAPSSTKNEKKKRDEQMHSTKKGNQWRFGMKIHAGVDAGTGLVHTITATSANVHDINEVHKLIREDDEVVYGDSGYIGIEKRDEIKNDEHLSTIEYRITKRPSSVKSKIKKGINWDKKIESRKASVRCKVEHPFLVVKRQFGYCKAVYKGLEKNLNRLFILFGFANLVKLGRTKRLGAFCLCTK